MGLLVGHSGRVLLGLVQLKHLGILGQLAGVFLGHIVGILLGLVQLEYPGLLGKMSPWTRAVGRHLRWVGLITSFSSLHREVWCQSVISALAPIRTHGEQSTH